MSNFRVPHIVGNKFRRDHQYWPTTTAERLRELLLADGVSEVQADDRIALLKASSCDLNLLMKLAWRVREWTVSAGTFSYNGTEIVGLATEPWTMEGSWDEFTVTTKRVGEFGDIDVADESKILGPVSDFNEPFIFKTPTLRNLGLSGIIEGTGTLQVGDDPPFALTGGNVGFLGFRYYVIVDPDLNLFYPNISITGNFFANAVAPRVEVLFTNSSQERLAATPEIDAGGALTIANPGATDSSPLPLEISGSYLNNFIFGPEGTGTVSPITLTPTRWWPCQNSLRQPVFDETDGHQVNDPWA